MAFTGKATYLAGADLPEIAEDVSDLVGIISPFETPLLDVLGDPLRAATSTHHEWLEDSLLINKDTINDGSISDPDGEITVTMNNGSIFRAGDQVQADGSEELILVAEVNGNDLTLVRGYGGTTPENLINGSTIRILGNAGLEGADKPAVRFTNRVRKGNYTQIFTASVEVSGTDMAVTQIGVTDEMDYQKQERLRELLRDLENTVINGGMPNAAPQGSATVRRSMKGIIPHLQSHIYRVGADGFPEGTGLTEAMVNYVLRKIWEESSAAVDLIVTGGFQKRAINGFLTESRSYHSGETAYRDLVRVYESDFGVCRILTTRWMPADAVLFLDSSRVSVLPMAGRSFHFKQLASSGDYECGELIGEYTLELRNEAAHGIIRGLATE